MNSIAQRAPLIKARIAGPRARLIKIAIGPLAGAAEMALRSGGIRTTTLRTEGRRNPSNPGPASWAEKKALLLKEKTLASNASRREKDTQQ
jgi:hypothetical protein